MKITNRIVEAYLDCKYKAHLSKREHRNACRYPALVFTTDDG
jgi:hypothetical protein